MRLPQALVAHRHERSRHVESPDTEAKSFVGSLSSAR
jgi:hypothetical protein